tara:strand:- start:231 stop:554 length:324 start_codon:yes stop_codon:yes gene_type:complete
MTKPQMETRKLGIPTNLAKNMFFIFPFDQTKIVLCLINEVGKRVILSIEIYNKNKKNEKQKTTNKKHFKKKDIKKYPFVFFMFYLILRKKHCPFVNCVFVQHTKTCL